MKFSAAAVMGVDEELGARIFSAVIVAIVDAILTLARCWFAGQIGGHSSLDFCSQEGPFKKNFQASISLSLALRPWLQISAGFWSVGTCLQSEISVNSLIRLRRKFSKVLNFLSKLVIDPRQNS